jgi:hypothetical protein
MFGSLYRVLDSPVHITIDCDMTTQRKPFAVKIYLPLPPSDISFVRETNLVASSDISLHEACRFQLDDPRRNKVEIRLCKGVRQV